MSIRKTVSALNVTLLVCAGLGLSACGHSALEFRPEDGVLVSRSANGCSFAWNVKSGAQHRVPNTFCASPIQDLDLNISVYRLFDNTETPKRLLEIQWVPAKHRDEKVMKRVQLIEHSETEVLRTDLEIPEQWSPSKYMFFSANYRLFYIEDTPEKGGEIAYGFWNLVEKEFFIGGSHGPVSGFIAFSTDETLAFVELGTGVAAENSRVIRKHNLSDKTYEDLTAKSVEVDFNHPPHNDDPIPTRIQRAYQQACEENAGRDACTVVAANGSVLATQSGSQPIVIHSKEIGDEAGRYPVKGVYLEATGAFIPVHDVHERTVVTVTYTPEAQRVVSATECGEMVIWDAQSGAPLMRRVSKPEEGVLSKAIMSDDGTYLVASYRGGAFKIILEKDSNEFWSVLGYSK